MKPACFRLYFPSLGEPNALKLDVTISEMIVLNRIT